MPRFSQFVSLCLCVAILSLNASISAQEEHDEDRAALRQLMAEYKQAVGQGVPELLKPHLADDFSGVMITAEQVDSLDSVEAYWEEIQGLLGEGGTYRTEIELAGPATFAGDYAFAHGTTADTAITGDGNRYRVAGRWTAICRKDGEQWKIVRIHGSMDPIQNEFVWASVKQTAIVAAAAGGLLGVIVGMLVAMLLRRGAAPQRTIPPSGAGE